MVLTLLLNQLPKALCIAPKQKGNVDPLTGRDQVKVKGGGPHQHIAVRLLANAPTFERGLGQRQLDLRLANKVTSRR